MVCCTSRILKNAEKNYSTIEKECLAIKYCIDEFQSYIFGLPFKILIDHYSLCWLFQLRTPNARLARWSLALQGFDCEKLIY